MATNGLCIERTAAVTLMVLSRLCSVGTKTNHNELWQISHHGDKIVITLLFLNFVQWNGTLSPEQDHRIKWSSAPYIAGNKSASRKRGLEFRYLQNF